MSAEDTFDHIRRAKVTAEQARASAAFCRTGPAPATLTPAQREANARFWETIAEMCDNDEADWLP